MMTADQVKNVTDVYTKFIQGETNRGWSELDDYMNYLEYLSDDQTVREADVVYEIHKRGKTKCYADHPDAECFVPRIIEAVGAIIELNRETGQLHKNNRYILETYLAYSEAGLIIVY